MAPTLEEALANYKTALALSCEKGLEAEREMKRRLGRQDLFYLLVFILKRRDAVDPWIYDRCRDVQLEPNGCLDVWARFHYKSTIITFAKTIQDILLDPEITIGIFSNTADLAVQFLRQIKQEFQDNGELKTLYSDVLWSDPEKLAPKWSEKDGIIVKRRGNPKEATVEAWGLIDNQPTSKHFKLRVYDDVVTQESIGNPETIKKTTERWELSNALGTEGGFERYAGTFYHGNDTYQEIMRRGIVKVRRHPVTDNGRADGEPVLISADYMAKTARSMGVSTFAMQMLLDPKGGSVKAFKRENVRYWTPKRAGLNVYIIVDPSSGKKRYKGGRIVNDYTSMLVFGVDANHNRMVLDIVRDRLNLDGRTKKLFELHRKFRPIQQVGYEETGMQSDIEHIKLEQERMNYRFDITALGTNIPKGDVIESCLPQWEAGMWYLPHSLPVVNSEGKAEDIVQTFLVEEFDIYPVPKHDDALNAFGLSNHVSIVIRTPTTDFTKIAASRVRAASRKSRSMMVQ